MIRPRKPSRYDTWLDRVHAEQHRSKEDFVLHFRTKYDDRLPVWVVTEILGFGALSMLYRGMQRADRHEVAAGLGLLDRQERGDGRILADRSRSGRDGLPSRMARPTAVVGVSRRPSRPGT
ncbi:MAG: Abi family protein [Phycicoccus sp.]